MLRILDGDLESAQRRTEDGRKMAAEMRLAGPLPQSADLDRKDPRARVQERPALQPARAIRHLAGKEPLRASVEPAERVRVLVRRRGERKGRMAREPERVVDESAQIGGTLHLSLLERRLQPGGMDESAGR